MCPFFAQSLARQKLIHVTSQFLWIYSLQTNNPHPRAVEVSGEPVMVEKQPPASTISALTPPFTFRSPSTQGSIGPLQE